MEWALETHRYRTPPRTRKPGHSTTPPRSPSPGATTPPTTTPNHPSSLRSPGGGTTSKAPKPTGAAALGTRSPPHLLPDPDRHPGQPAGTAATRCSYACGDHARATAADASTGCRREVTGTAARPLERDPPWAPGAPPTARCSDSGDAGCLPASSRTVWRSSKPSPRTSSSGSSRLANASPPAVPWPTRRAATPAGRRVQDAHRRRRLLVGRRQEGPGPGAVRAPRLRTRPRGMHARSTQRGLCRKVTSPVPFGWGRCPARSPTRAPGSRLYSMNWKVHAWRWLLTSSGLSAMRGGKIRSRLRSKASSWPSTGPPGTTTWKVCGCALW